MEEILKKIICSDVQCYLSFVFKFAIDKRYCWGYVESRISKCEYFKFEERNISYCTEGFPPTKLLKEIFEDYLPEINSFNEDEESKWLSTSYLLLLKKYKVTFEAIFIYLPIEELIDYYKNHKKPQFEDVLVIFENNMKEFTIFTKYYSEQQFRFEFIPKADIEIWHFVNKLRKAPQSINHADVSLVSRLASYLSLRPETLAESKLYI